MAQFTGQVGDGEQQVSQLRADLLVVFLLQSPTEFAALFVEFFEDSGRVGPVESGAGRLLGDALCSLEGGHGPGYPIDRGGRGASFGGFYRLPVPGHGVGIVDVDISKHVWMASLELGRDPCAHVLDGESSMLALARHLGMEDHLEQEISEFCAELVGVVIVDGLGH